MKTSTITTAMLIASLLGGCGGGSTDSVQNAQPAASAPAGGSLDTSAVVATVNGQPITEAMIALYSQQRQARTPGSPAPERSAVLSEVINLELASQDGEKKGIQNTPDVALQIDQQRRAVIASATIKQQLAANPVPDDELRKMYDEKVGGGSSEYKARHILVEDKDKAVELIGQLDEGADFSEMAKEHSTGPSGKNGGDLGWFSPKQMVPEFSQAVATMKKGEYSSEPVKTQFGWHIIMLDDVRQSTPPPFEQVKSQLQMVVQNQKIQEYIQQLKDGASIEIKDESMKQGGAPATP